MFDWGNCLFAAQIFAAEFIFLYSYPKRSHFWARVVPGVGVLIFLAALYPNIPFDGTFAYQVFQFVKYIAMFAISVAYLAFCFKVKAIALISACVAGYALQHLSYHLMLIVSLTPLLEGVAQRSHILELMVFPITYVCAWATFGRQAAKYEFYKNYDARFIFISIFTMFVCLVINRFSRQSSGLANIYVSLGNSLYAISCCLLALLINLSLNVLSITSAKNKTLERIGYEERRQFEVSKKNREQLNVKYHDLKHVLSLIDSGSNAEVVAQYKKVIEDYDSEVRTGNETVDIVVNEKVDTCRAENISLTFLGDGSLLSFVSQYDIYSLFGNILDNAIEAVMKITDRAKRIISVTIKSQANCVAISAINYFNGGDIKMSGGLPATTKTADVGSHGYGMRSVQLIAQKYGGDVSVRVDGDMFDLTVFLMEPQKRKAAEENG